MFDSIAERDDIEVSFSNEPPGVSGNRARMPFPSHREERFRVLNGLAPTEELEPGWWIKYVSE